VGYRMGEAFRKQPCMRNNNRHRDAHPDLCRMHLEFDPEADIISKNNSVTLGDQQTELTKSLMIFPNPTSNIVTIQKPENLEVNEIRIFNIIGQLLYQQNWTPKIDLTSFSIGLLFIQFQTNEGIINKSVLKN
jgi:hypothetical protein